MYTLGIDIGSTACKCIILRDGETIVGKSLYPLGTGTIGPKKVFDGALEEAGLTREDIHTVLATGYGRLRFDDADTQKTEITCHAAGIHYLMPAVRTIVDIGGQDIKALRLDSRGRLENFVMNDKCAAGTGRFLDVMAGVLNVKTSDLGALSDDAESVVSISSTCTVFAESEVISLLSNNVRIPDLVAGIHASVAGRVAALALRNGVVPDVTMSGGVALNHGMVRALSAELKTPITVHPLCQYAGALGAALIAYREATK